MAERPIWGIITAVLACGILSAEQLPVEPVTVAQGLASNTIHKIVRDSRGFLWFCTGAGLSRFDGHQFVNFGPSQGFPGQVVWDFPTKTAAAIRTGCCADCRPAQSGRTARWSAQSSRRALRAQDD